MGEVIPLRPTQPLTCDSCYYVMYGHAGTYCSLYREEVIDERVATECEGFDPA